MTTPHALRVLLRVREIRERDARLAVARADAAARAAGDRAAAHHQALAAMALRPLASVSIQRLAGHLSHRTVVAREAAALDARADALADERQRQIGSWRDADAAREGAQHLLDRHQRAHRQQVARRDQQATDEQGQQSSRRAMA